MISLRLLLLPLLLTVSLAGNALAAAPETAPALSLPDLNGKSQSLAQWRGRLVMLNFWASWCPSCQYEIPDFVHWQRQYRGVGLQVVGVGIDEARPLGNVARTLDINYPVLVIDTLRGGQLLKDWGDESQLLPFTVIIDGAGNIVYRHRGTFDQQTFDYEVLPLLIPAPAAQQATATEAR